MTSWNEDDSTTYRAIAQVAVPRRREMVEALIAAAPFPTDKPLKILELGSGEGFIAEALLTRFPAASLTALDGSESMRTETASRLSPFGARARVAAFDLAALDWWDRMSSVDLVVSSLSLHHLNDAKKQYLYKAAADRLSARGALLIADLVDPQHPAVRDAAAGRWDTLARQQAEAIGAPGLFRQFLEERWNHFRFPDASDEPSALLHHLLWLRHAGFAAVDCWWMDAGHAVFGGFKQAAASTPRPQAGS
jgi:tRNA (cmo5U34)-methyltransferase